MNVKFAALAALTAASLVAPAAASAQDYFYARPDPWTYRRLEERRFYGPPAEFGPRGWFHEGYGWRPPFERFGPYGYGYGYRRPYWRD